MESRKDIYRLWVQYTTKNDEEFFREFIKRFVEAWESQLSLDWDHLPGWQSLKPDSGPFLSRLPEELLPAISKFTYIARDLADTNQLTADNLTDARYLLRCLIILCRHMDNIPFVASCDFVGQSIGLASSVVRLLASGSPEITERGIEYFFTLCHLMECLYDPYFSWRNFINGVLPDFTKLIFQPSLLHVEVVPFLYECFETELIHLYPKMCAELMHILGAIISGAQSTLVHLSPLSLERRGSKSDGIEVIYEGHNALRAICPAMVNLTMNLVTTPSVPEIVWQTALHCFVIMVRVLSKSSPEQRQIEVGSLICQAKEACLIVVEADIPSQEIGMMLVHIVNAFRRLLTEEQSREAIRLLLLENHVMDAVVVAMDRSIALKLEPYLLAKECVWTLTEILKNSPKAKEKAEKSGILEGFLACLKGINPSKGVLRSLLSMAIEDDFEDNMDTAQMRIGNADIIGHLISWLPGLGLDQLWLATCLNHICSANLWCKRTASDQGVIIKISKVLNEDTSLNIHTAHALISLVQNLAQHSFSPLELKHMLKLLDDSGNKRIPYRSQLVRAISVVSLREEHKVCDVFFDIQNNSQGISVPDISKWSSGNYGFSLAAWVRLSRLDAAETLRRQLFNLATSSGTGMQIFFRGDGAIVVGVTTKKEFLVACVPSPLLSNNHWHHIVVCFAAARRHFGQSQITVFVDGEQVLNVSLKFPSLSDFVVCTIGTVAQGAPKYSCETTERSGTVSNIIATSRLPNLMNLVPSHFTLPLRGSSAMDPHVKSFPPGIQDTVWGASTCLRGQLGQVAIFHDSLNPAHVKTLYTSGANSRHLFNLDDTPANELVQKLVLCFSPLASWGELCVDLAPGGKFPGHVTADLIHTVSMKNAVSGVGGLSAFLPLLEQSARYESGPDLSLFSSQNKLETSDWTGHANSALADQKLEQNPVSAFLIILKNLITNGHEDSAAKDEVLAVAGYLLSRVDSQLLDVNFLMSVQLILEAVKNSNHSTVLKAVYQHVLFNFKIWSLCSFPIRFEHMQYLTKVVKEDGKFLRKKYGVQFLLDVIRRYYTGIELLSNEDSRVIRQELLVLLKSFIHKDTNVHQVSAVLKFLFAVKEECLVIEVLDMLNSYLESKHCRDQVYLLLYEPQSIELLYGVLVDTQFTIELKQKIVKLFGLLLRYERVYEIYKARLRLQDGSVISSSTGMASGFVSLLSQEPLNMEVVVMLLNQFLSIDTDNGYSAALTLTYALSQADLEIKMKVAEKLLTTAFMRPGAAQLIAKQTAWQDSITTLLIKKPINVEQQHPEAHFPDLMTFEHDSAAAVPAPYDALSNAFEGVAGLVTDNINYAADNLSSVVASAYSVIRQKTVEMQESLEDARLRIVPGAGSDTGHDSSGSDEDANNLSRSESCEPEETEVIIEDDVVFNELASQWEKLSVEKTGDKEEELSYMVMNLLWTVLWRGVDGSSMEAWRQRGQLMTTINLLSLNNELYISHLTLKLQILEMSGEAALADLKKMNNIAVEHSENAAQLLRWIYDLMVVDPHEDMSKKTSIKLLDIVLKMIDVLTIFQESPVDEWSDMVKLSLGILLQCSQSTQLDLCARSTAKLHSLLQTRSVRDINEGGYMLYVVNKNILNSFNDENDDLYSFLLPLMKTLLEKLSTAFTYPSVLPNLPSLSSGPLFFEEFRNYCRSDEWTTFISNKIRPLYNSYTADLENELTEPLNVFWAECYEASKLSVTKRNREVAESKIRFQRQIIDPLRTKQAEELARFNNVMSQERHQRWQMKKKWRLMKQFLMGPRGAWAIRNGNESFWKLSHYENIHRMRLKFYPNLFFDNHINASNARDNTGWMSRGQSVDDLHVHFALPVVGRKDDEDEISIDEDFGMATGPEIENPASGKEKPVLSQECELVTLMTVVKGRLDITTTHIYFYDLRPVKEDLERLDFRCPLFKLREIYLRQYNLRRTAIEIFLIDHTNYFINFTPKTRNRILSSIYSLRPPNLVYFGNKSPADRLRSSGLIQRWVNHEISNFDYIMQLNTLAGRSFNDLSQYPVFPWIIADYTSEVLDLNEPHTFRDLSKPIGIVNPRNEAEVKAKYEGFDDPNGIISKFHYGTHYSNSGGVLHYLVRVEPFTTLHVNLQSGKFDVADRQFHSISQTWRMLMDNPNDVKELIPEFFYLPEFLKNLNNFNLGLLQGSKQRVHDVILPPWASSPEEFISIHRKALESEYVSLNLHHWIDLIFGYKQKGPAAVEALNVFYYCSYEGAVDLDSIKDPYEREAVEGMINNFGQTPRQLLKEPHPQRLTWEATISKMMKSEVKKLDFTLFLDNLANTCIKVSNENDPVVYLSPPRSAPSRGFLPSGPFDNLISIHQSGIFGCNFWSPFDKHSELGFVFDVDVSVTNAKSRKKLPASFPPSMPLNSKMFAVSLDGKLIFSVGHWDYSLQLFSVFKGKTIASVVHHFDLVTCVALDICGYHLVTGSRDTTCVLWDVSHICVPNSSPPGLSTPKPLHVLHGHDHAVTCVGVVTELDMVVSGSLDGTVNVHTIQEGQYLRTLRPMEAGAGAVITFLALSNQGHVAFAAHDQMSHSVHVFSVNGFHVGSKYVDGQVTGLATAGDSLVVGDDAGDLTISRLLGLHPIYHIPLHVPIQSVVVTPGCTHLLIPLHDGSVVVVGIRNVHS